MSFKKFYFSWSVWGEGGCFDLSDTELLPQYCVASIFRAFKNEQRWKAFLKMFILSTVTELLMT